MNLKPLLRTTIGLLLLGGAVLGVLASGKGLRAPPPLAGAWRVADGAGCVGEALTLAQSGVYLHATGRLALRGKLDGDRVWLTAECEGGSVALAGTWTPSGMDAHVRAPGCGCADAMSVAAAPR